MLKEYIAEMFEPTLLFGVFAGMAGLSAASYYKNYSTLLGIIAIAGAVIAQMAVNLIDDYSDYKTGLDRETSKTKFSGGSTLVVGKKISASVMLWIAAAALIIAGAIGVYLLSNSHAIILPMLVLIAIGGIAALFYARYLTHVPLFAEPFVAACFAFIGIGVFIVSSGRTTNALYAALVCIPCGIQVGVATLTNAIPDRKPDKKYGRRSWAVMLNDNKRSGILYITFEGIGYVLLIFGMYARILPYTFSIMLIFIPIFQYIAMNIMKYRNAKSYEKVMGVNAAVTMSYMLMISIAFILAFV